MSIIAAVQKLKARTSRFIVGCQRACHIIVPKFDLHSKMLELLPDIRIEMENELCVATKSSRASYSVLVQVLTMVLIYRLW